jgi:antitoxin CcdA
MSASKKAVNLSVDAALLRAARDRGINLSGTLERALEDALRQDRRARWLADNRQRIAAYNEQVEAHGAFADTLRSF